MTSKMSVCHGYAVLTEALLRGAGIPARVVNGMCIPSVIQPEVAQP